MLETSLSLSRRMNHLLGHLCRFAYLLKHTYMYLLVSFLKFTCIVHVSLTLSPCAMHVVSFFCTEVLANTPAIVQTRDNRATSDALQSTSVPSADVYGSGTRILRTEGGKLRRDVRPHIYRSRASNVAYCLTPPQLLFPIIYHLSVEVYITRQ